MEKAMLSLSLAMKEAPPIELLKFSAEIKSEKQNLTYLCACVQE